MKTYRLALAVLGMATLATTACKKKDDPAPTREELVARTWTMTARTSSPAYPVINTQTGQTSFQTDLFASLDACKKDDLFIFKKGGVFSQEEGASKCNNANPTIIKSGTWALSSDGNTLVMPFLDTDTEVVLQSVSDKVMVGSFTIGQAPNTYTQTLTFTARQ